MIAERPPYRGSNMVIHTHTHTQLDVRPMDQFLLQPTSQWYGRVKFNKLQFILWNECHSVVMVSYMQLTNI